MKTNNDVEMPRPILVVRGEVGDGIEELVTRKLAVLADTRTNRC